MSKKKPGLIRETTRFFRLHQRILLLVVGCVSLTTNLISVLGDHQETVSAYISMASLVMSVALIWVIVNLHKGQPVTLRKAYHDGTASLVRFILVAIILSLQLVPFGFGIGAYYLGTAGATSVVSAGEHVLLVLLALLLASPSIFWMVRYIFSLYIVVADGLGPIAALRASKKVTKGHFWKIIRRIAVLLLVLLAVVLIPSIAVAFVGGLASNKWLMAILQGVLVTIMLPFMNIYLYKLYLQLAEGKA